MGLVWNPLGAIGVLVALVAWTLAAVIFKARPDRAQNRLLALLLACEGGIMVGGAGTIYLTDDPRTAYAAQAVTDVFFAPMVAVYLLFLGTIASPVAAPLRHRLVRAVLWASVVLLPLATIARLDLFVAGVGPVAYASWEGQPGPWRAGSRMVMNVILALALVVTLDAWRRAPLGSAKRSRAAAYAVAFGIRDANFLSMIVASLVGYMPMPATQYRLSLVGLAYLFALSYAILRHQLFDIDLRLKWTIRRGTVVAFFVAAFFVVSETLAAVLSERIGTFLGIAVAGGLLFFLAPLQRVADRLSDRAMPHVRDDEEYRTVRKREVYRAAVESAAQDGRITERERDVLATLVEQLGLKPTDARAIERESVNGGAPA